MKHKLLIVDDEVYIAQGISDSMDWESLGIETVLQTHSAKQAKLIFHKEQIDILLCDIEMPQENGLELLGWVNNNFPDTAAILLTCHADFVYAKQALKLGSLDYLLKPAENGELKEAIIKAKAYLAKSMESRFYKQTYEYYFKRLQDYRPLMKEIFWRHILYPQEDFDAAQIAEIKHSLDLCNRLFLPIYIQIMNWERPLSDQEMETVEYALRETAERFFTRSHQRSQVVPLKEGGMLAVVDISEVTADNLKELCLGYIEVCNQQLYCELSCLIGEPVPAEQMSQALELLQVFKSENVIQRNTVTGIGNEASATVQIMRRPPIDFWKELIKLRLLKEFSEEAEQYLLGLERAEASTAITPQTVYHEMQQMFLSALNLNGFSLNKLFAQESSIQHSGEAAQSFSHLNVWVQSVVQRLSSSIHPTQSTVSIIDQMKKYIAEHIDQNFTREQLGEYVGLHPDYASKLFKKETGITVTDYTAKERIRMARELLTKTEMPISSIALSVGFSNFSYFAKVFRKWTQQNPQDFRKGSAG